jgi:short-subunit dehydrogenase
MSHWSNKVVLITGGSSGFGRVLAQEFAQHGAQVVIAARDAARLHTAAAAMHADGLQVHSIVCDVTQPADVERMFLEISQRYGRLDVLVNNAGRSDRGAAIETSVEQFRELLELNFLSLVRCTQAALPLLAASRGQIVNIGSLAAKTVSRFIGAYPASKFPVAAYSQQLRLELAERGVHVLLVCPGPIALADRADKYERLASEKGLPDDAGKPGGGVKLRGLDPAWLSRRVLRACERREAELIVPVRVRWLLAVSAIAPRLGDWIIRKMTSG